MLTLGKLITGFANDDFHAICDGGRFFNLIACEEKNYDSEFLDLFNSLPECEQTEIKEIVKLKCRKCAVSQTRKQHEKKDLLDFQFD